MIFFVLPPYLTLTDDFNVLCFSYSCVIMLGIAFISTALSYGQSNSDIEALHQAYCHIAHSLGDAEKRIESTEMEYIKSSMKEHFQENEESSKNISTTESGKKNK